MKHDVKKIGTAAGVALLAAALLSGCGKQNATETGLTGKSRVTFMLMDFAGSPMSGEKAGDVLDAITSYTDTDIEFQFVPHDNYDEKVGLTLANPDSMPMIMYVNKVAGGIVDAADAGAFWDLNDFIWDGKKYPNLSRANKEVSKALTIGGDLIGLYRARDLGRYGLGYRADWAEKLGLSEPKTVEDVYNMLKAFRERDPDGNGVRDTYGLAMCRYTGSLDIIQTWFGCGNGWVEQDGMLVPVHHTKAYKDALNWMRKVYEEDLIATDWAVRNTTTWQDQVKKGEAGMFIDVLDSSRRIWDYFVTSNVPSVSPKYETAAMNLVGTINGKTLATPGYNGFFVITKGAKTKAQVEACLHFLDKMNDDAMIALCNYGLEGWSYKLDEDGYVVVRKDDPNMSKAYGALDQALCFIPHTLAQIKPTIRKTDRKLKELSVIADNEKHAVINPALAYLSNSPAYALEGAMLDQILSDARTQYICGRIDEAGLQAAFDKWDKVGADVIKEVNEQYKANQR